MEIQPHNECFARQALSPLWLFPAVPGSLGMSKSQVYFWTMQIPIEPCWHLNLHQTSHMDKVDARMIFVSKDINIHIPARSCCGTISHPELLQDPVDRQGENWSSEMIVEGCR